MVAQCDALINFIQQRKVELIEAITTEMNSKIQKVKEQVKACDKKSQGVAGLLQYASECLQGTDAASFLLVNTILLQHKCSGYFYKHKTIYIDKRKAKKLEVCY